MRRKDTPAGPKGHSLTVMDTASATAFARTMAGKARLRAVLHDEPLQPYTDPVSMTLHVEKPRWTWTEEQHADWRGKLLHEIGHHIEKNGEIMDYFVSIKIDMKSLRGTVVNILTDYINDRQWGELGYTGAMRDVAVCQYIACRRGLEVLAEKGVPEPGTKQGILVRVFSWIYGRRAATYQPILTALACEWQRAADYPALIPFNEELEAMTDGPSVVNLANKIVPPDDDEEDEGDSGEGEGEGDGEEGEQGGEGEGEGDPDGGDEKSGDPDKKGEGGGWVSYRDVLMADDHATKPEFGGKPVKIKYDHDWQNTYQPFNTFNEVDLAKEVK